MTADAIISEGERIAMPCLLLSDAPSQYGVVGYWRGHGLEGYRGRNGDRHRVTFDCGWLARQGVRVAGSVALYDVDARWGWQTPLHVERFDAPLCGLRLAGGTPLFGREVASFPPLEAVCLYGGAAVVEWLASEGLHRTDYDCAAVTAVGEAYQRTYVARSPLTSGDEPHAILGGWHAIWPDDDFYLPREMRLVIWTLAEAEPWVEVFERSPNMPVRLRIT